MKILILIFFFILSNCTLNKVNNHHGGHFLKKFLAITKNNAFEKNTSSEHLKFPLRVDKKNMHVQT